MSNVNMLMRKILLFSLLYILLFPFVTNAVTVDHFQCIVNDDTKEAKYYSKSSNYGAPGIEWKQLFAGDNSTEILEKCKSLASYKYSGIYKGPINREYAKDIVSFYISLFISIIFIIVIYLKLKFKVAKLIAKDYFLLLLLLVGFIFVQYSFWFILFFVFTPIQ